VPMQFVCEKSGVDKLPLPRTNMDIKLPRYAHFRMVDKCFMT
jgi:hypothetical protein